MERHRPHQSAPTVDHRTIWQQVMLYVQVLGVPSATIDCQSEPRIWRADNASEAAEDFLSIMRTTIPWEWIPDQPSYLLLSPSIINRSPPFRITSTAAVLKATFRAPWGPHAGAAVVDTLKDDWLICWTVDCAHPASAKANKVAINWYFILFGLSISFLWAIVSLLFRKFPIKLNLWVCFEVRNW